MGKENSAVGESGQSQDALSLWTTVPSSWVKVSRASTWMAVAQRELSVHSLALSGAVLI